MNNSASPYQLLLMDLDGTIVNTLPDRINAINYMLYTLKLAPINEDNIKGYIGDGVVELINRALMESLHFPTHLDPALIKNGIIFYEDYYLNHICDKSYLYPSVLDTIILLKERGLKLALISNKRTIHTQSLVRALGLMPYFDLILGGSDGARKPDPELLLLALKRLHIEAAKAIMIGDSIDDFHAAKNAHIRMIGVTYGYRPLTPYVCPELITQFSQLIPYFVGKHTKENT